MQLLLALAIVRAPAIWSAVDVINRGVAAIETATLAGLSYMFGYLGGAPIPFVLKPDGAQPMVIAFQILPLIVFSALTAPVRRRDAADLGWLAGSLASAMGAAVSDLVTPI